MSFFDWLIRKKSHTVLCNHMNIYLCMKSCKPSIGKERRNWQSQNLENLLEDSNRCRNKQKLDGTQSATWSRQKTS